MSAVTAVQLLARYNFWADRKVVEHISKIARAELRNRADATVDAQCVYNTPVPIFFKSIHATMNHIAGVDDLWLHRCAANGTPRYDWLYAESTKPEAWLMVEPNWDATCRNLLTNSEQLLEYTRSLVVTELDQFVRYTNTEGKPAESQRGAALFHVLNHGTHHRGQIHAALSFLGHPGPVLDMSAMGTSQFRIL